VRTRPTSPDSALNPLSSKPHLARFYHLNAASEIGHAPRARYRGLKKMNEQVILTATVQNLKRLVKFLNKPRTPMPNRAVVRPTAPLLAAITAIASSFRNYGRRLMVIIEAFSMRHTHLQLQTT
jgi:hypothetical protein